MIDVKIKYTSGDHTYLKLGIERNLYLISCDLGWYCIKYNKYQKSLPFIGKEKEPKYYSNIGKIRNLINNIYGQIISHSKGDIFEGLNPYSKSKEMCLHSLLIIMQLHQFNKYYMINKCDVFCSRYFQFVNSRVDRVLQKINRKYKKNG